MSASPAYLAARKVEVYRAALEESRAGAGGIDLAALRARLGLTERDHALLEQALRRPAQAPAQPGDVVLGRYRLGRVLGEGAFGRAFLADDLRVGRQVVLKALPGDPGGQAALREARAMAAVRHPNVATFHDVIETGTGGYLVLEHVEGGSLAQRLARGPLDEQAFGRVALGALRGLGAIHAAGIVHRDVKPSNVLLTGDGEAKLADFGVAHLPGFGTTAGATGGPVGTARYMSPEQAKGRRVDARSDLYSLAATLHEALTGRAHLGEVPGETAAEVQMRAARGRRFRPPAGMAPKLSAWFARALDPAPARRFPDAASMARELEAALGPARAGRAGVWARP